MGRMSERHSDEPCCTGHRLPSLCTRTEIWELATTLRAANVMRPYLEAYSAT